VCQHLSNTTGDTLAVPSQFIQVGAEPVHTGGCRKDGEVSVQWMVIMRTNLCLSVRREAVGTVVDSV
jgi:hypothetical protein